jgi:hypothetical protein
VRCVGQWRALPLLRFEGRLDKTSDLRGEKLSAVVVEAALRRVLGDVSADFVMVAPSLTPSPHYALFLEASASDARCEHLRAALETAFLEEHHYRYCRELGQLAALTLHRVRDGRRRWSSVMQARGLKLGDVKPSGFDVTPGWEAHLASPTER